MRTHCHPTPDLDALAFFDHLLGLPIVTGPQAVEIMRKLDKKGTGDSTVDKGGKGTGGTKPRKPAGTRKLQALENLLDDALLDAWIGDGAAAVDEVLAVLEAGAGALTEAEVLATLDAVAARMSDPFAASVVSEVADVVEESYDLGRKAFTKEPTFGLVDERAREALTEHNTYWIGEHYGDHVGPRIAETVQTEIIEAGLGRAEAGEALRAIFEPEFGPRSEDYWRGVAANAVTKSRNLGAVESMNEAGFDELVPVNPRDEATSDICLYLTSGRIVFQVARAVEQRDAVIKARTPEAAKKASPWLPFAQIDGKSADELMDMGVLMSPYHFHCRTILVVR